MLDDRREQLNSYWCNRWTEGSTGWAFPGVNPFLKAYFNLLVENINIQGKRVLVPLCGKTPDLLWLCEQGLSVTGIEFAEMAIKDFFKENGLSFKLFEDNGLKVYKCVDKNIAIYQGDFFSMNSEVLGGVFDLCCDISSFSAMIPDEQKLYVDKLLSFLSPDVRLILNCFEYNAALRSKKPPYAVFRDNTFTFEELCRNSEDTLPEGYTSRIGVNTIHVYYLLKSKNV